MDKFRTGPAQSSYIGAGLNQNSFKINKATYTVVSSNLYQIWVSQPISLELQRYFLACSVITPMIHT